MISDIIDQPYNNNFIYFLMYFCTFIHLSLHISVHLKIERIHKLFCLVYFLYFVLLYCIVLYLMSLSLLYKCVILFSLPYLYLYVLFSALEAQPVNKTNSLYVCKHTWHSSLFWIWFLAVLVFVCVCVCVCVCNKDWMMVHYLLPINARPPPNQALVNYLICSFSFLHVHITF